MAYFPDEVGCYAVIATTTLKPMTPDLHRRYLAMSDRMLDLAGKMDGFLGREAARDAQSGISVSYWRSLEAIGAWRDDSRHMATKEFGRENVYATCHIRICRIERAYDMGAALQGIESS